MTIKKCPRCGGQIVKGECLQCGYEVAQKDRGRCKSDI